jgi:crotonobetainyl-CoA:carnitine CoA-transferase CaiB-like acyl-CoA transferase
MNNLRGDQPDKLGLTYGALAPHNPRIVCAHLSAYGRDNERAGWPGYDYLMQSEAGFLSLTGEPGTPPARFGLSIIDFMTGIVTAVGLLAAIIGARESGRGRDVDVSLFDVALHQLSYPATWYLNEGEITTRLPRGSHPSATPAQLVKTADGWIFVMCMLEKFWITMLKELDRLDLAADADFVDMESRRRHRDRLTGVLDEIFGTAPTEHWLGRLQGRIPVAPVYDVPQALDNEFVERIGMLQRLAHPQKGELRVLRNPIRIDGHRLGGRVCPPLGSDTDSVLRRLGFDDEDISRLEAAGAVGRGDAA